LSSPFAPGRDGIVVSLGEAELSLLRELPVVLASIEAERGGPAHDRLNPAAYRSDREAEDEYRRLMTGELDRARADDRDLFVDSAHLAHPTLTIAEAEAWVRVIGDARLALAARSGIVAGDDEWEHRVGSDPDLTLVAWLGHLQASLIDALGEPGGA
jgi:Domain of unknown function (DUF2017)